MDRADNGNLAGEAKAGRTIRWFCREVLAKYLPLAALGFAALFLAAPSAAQELRLERVQVKDPTLQYLPCTGYDDFRLKGDAHEDLSPGERVSLDLLLRNSSTSEITGVIGTLECNTASIFIQNPTCIEGGGVGVRWDNIGANEMMLNKDPFILDLSQALECFERVTFSLNLAYSIGGSPKIAKMSFAIPFFSLYDTESAKHIKFSTSPEVSILPSAAERPGPTLAYGEGEFGLFFGQSMNIKFSKLDIDGNPLTDPEETGFWGNIYRGVTIFNPESEGKYNFLYIDSGAIYLLEKTSGTWSRKTILATGANLPIGAVFNPKAGHIAVVYTGDTGDTMLLTLLASSYGISHSAVSLGVGNKDFLAGESCSIVYMPPINPSDPGYYYVAFAEHDGVSHQLHIEAAKADDLSQSPVCEVLEALTDQGKPSLIANHGERTLAVAFLRRDGGDSHREIWGNIYDEGLVSIFGTGYQAMQMTTHMPGTEADEPVLMRFWDYMLAWNERNTLSGSSGRVKLGEYWPDFNPMTPSWVELQSSYLSGEWYELGWLSGAMTIDRARVFWHDKRTSTDHYLGIHSATAIPQDPLLPTNVDHVDDVILSQAYERSLHPTLASTGFDTLCAWWYKPSTEANGAIYTRSISNSGVMGPAASLTPGFFEDPMDADPVAISTSGSYKIFWKGQGDIYRWPGGTGSSVAYESPTAKFLDAAGLPDGSQDVILFKDMKVANGDATFNLYAYLTGDEFGQAVRLTNLPSTLTILDASVTSLPTGSGATWAVAWVEGNGYPFDISSELKLARLDAALVLVGSVQTLYTAPGGRRQVQEVEIAASDSRVVVLHTETLDAAGVTLEVRARVLCTDGTEDSMEPIFAGFVQKQDKTVFNNLQLHWTGSEFLVSLLQLGGEASMGAYQYHFLYGKLDSNGKPILWPTRIATLLIRMFDTGFDFDVSMNSEGGAAVYNMDVVSAESNVYFAELGWKPELQHCALYNEAPIVTPSQEIYTVNLGDDVTVDATVTDDDMGDYVETAGSGWDLLCDGSVDKTITPGFYQATFTRAVQEQNYMMWPTEYCIKLVAKDSNGLEGEGYATIKLVDVNGPTVTLNTPNGGNNIRTGELYTISWEGQDNVAIDHWQVFYTTNYGEAGETWTQIGGDFQEWERSTDWPVPTTISSKCRVKVKAWDSSNNTGEDVSDTNFYIVQNTTSAIRTIILTHTDRLDSYYGPGAGIEVWNKLYELKRHTKVDGALIDLKDVPGLNEEVTGLYKIWDATPTDTDANRLANVNAANAVASAIKSKVLDLVANTYQNAEYLVLAGNDRIIPFYRVADGTAISPESSYRTYVNENSPVGAAIDRKYYLTDAIFGDVSYDTTAAGVLFMALPDLATGRMVEDPSEIVATVDNFIAQDGQTNLETVLITGYDFLMDSATAMKASYTAAGKSVFDHIANSGWGAAEMESGLFNSTYSLQSINNHCDHANIGTPGTALTTTQIDTHGDLSLRGKLVYSVGCHSGLNAPDDDFASNNPLDLPQVLLRKGVMAFIGNTGYGWGMRYGSGYSERLAEMITSRLVSQQSMALGKAMLDAKQEYFLKDHRYDVFDEKVLFESTLFGLPMYKVQVSTSLVVPPPKELEGPGGPDYQEVNGIILEKKVNRDVGVLGDLPPGVTELTLNFDFTSSYPGSPVSTPDGDYWTLNGLASAELGDTLQPYFTYDSRLSGTVSHGVIFTGGTFTRSTGFDAVVGTADSSSYTPGGESPIGPMAGGFVPTITATHASSASSLVVTDLTRMTVNTGYFDSGTETRFNKMNFAMYYSNSADRIAPTITDPGESGYLHTLDGLTASFSVPVADASGIYRVVIAYTDDQAAWKSMDLSYSSTSGKWEGTLECKKNITYYAQAVDNAGNVGVLRKASADDEDYNGNPTGSTYEDPRLFKVTLADTDGDTLPDPWEDEYGLDKNDPDDWDDDPDYDLLTSLEEFNADTDPMNGDTDGDGDNDGSEKNNGRNPLVAGDGKRITITATKVGDDVRLDWPSGLGDNLIISGPYWVYRSLDPFFDSTEELDTTPEPLTDGTITYTDVGGGTGPTYYYTVTNARYLGPAPFVDSISPSSGPQAGNTLIRIYGDYFASGATVTIGGVAAASVTVVNSTTITCRTPSSLTAGAKDVRVTNLNGQYGEKAGGFTYY